MGEIKSARMPTLFLGHGSPMNAIVINDFTQFLQQHGEDLPRPKSILAISAHWEAPGLYVQKLEHPKTIHDFGGFPQELFEVQYPAPGSPDTADTVANLLKMHEVQTTDTWGLDHGTWSVLKHLYPGADIPVLQLSLNRNLSMRDHLRVAQDLKALRDQGVLILGSGNLVHNLRQIKWQDNAAPADWALEFDEYIKRAILERNFDSLTAQDTLKHSLWRMAHPSLEHYLPLLYVLGASDESEKLRFPYEGIQNSSISMRAVQTAA